MKAFIALFALVAVSNAGVVSYSGIVPALAHTGTSIQHRSQDSLGQYSFGYNEGHLGGGTFRKEVGDAFGNKAGSYGLTDADGRQRIVSYVADAAGYRADIKSNEPGVGVTLQDAAHTTVNKGLVVAPTAAVATYAAPAAVATYAAPAAVASYAAPALSHYAAAGYPLAHGVSHYAAGLPLAHHGLSHYAAGLPLAHHGLSHYAAAGLPLGLRYY